VGGSPYKYAPTLLLPLKKDWDNSTSVAVKYYPRKLNLLIRSVSPTHGHLKGLWQCRFVHCQGGLRCQERSVSDRVTVEKSTSTRILLEQQTVFGKFKESNICHKYRDKVCHILVRFLAGYTRGLADAKPPNVGILAREIELQSDLILYGLASTNRHSYFRPYFRYKKQKK
jgi:hypothetical protein